MIKGLTEEEKFKVLRPVIGECERDANYIPIISKVQSGSIDWDVIKPINVQNCSKQKNLSERMVLMFNYDKDLQRFWNNPLKYVPLFQRAALVCSPDFSVYPEMDYNQLRHNVYKNRWLGKIWQNYGIKILPTVSWAGSETYDLCFGAIEENSIVVISTYGCQNNPNLFLEGFNEMKRRIQPELIVVAGNMINGMTGTFVNYKYEDAFAVNPPYEQIMLFEESTVFEIKGEE